VLSLPCAVTLCRRQLASLRLTVPVSHSIGSQYLNERAVLACTSGLRTAAGQGHCLSGCGSRHMRCGTLSSRPRASHKTTGPNHKRGWSTAPSKRLRGKQGEGFVQPRDPREGGTQHMHAHSLQHTHALTGQTQTGANTTGVCSMDLAPGLPCATVEAKELVDEYWHLVRPALCGKQTKPDDTGLFERCQGLAESSIPGASSGREPT